MILHSLANGACHALQSMLGKLHLLHLHLSEIGQIPDLRLTMRVSWWARLGHDTIFRGSLKAGIVLFL
jgi:hypothetical protein